MRWRICPFLSRARINRLPWVNSNNDKSPLNFDWPTLQMQFNCSGQKWGSAANGPCICLRCVFVFRLCVLPMRTNGTDDSRLRTDKTLAADVVAIVMLLLLLLLRQPNRAIRSCVFCASISSQLMHSQRTASFSPVHFRRCSYAYGHLRTAFAFRTSKDVNKICAWLCLTVSQVISASAAVYSFRCRPHPAHPTVLRRCRGAKSTKNRFSAF